VRRHDEIRNTEGCSGLMKDRRLPATASVEQYTWEGDLGRKGEIDQHRTIAGCGVDVKLRTRSPSASCPAMVRGRNNSNDVWSPVVVVGEIMYEPWCLHSDVLATASITKVRPYLVGTVGRTRPRGFRLALTTTHQNNVDDSAWPELHARTVCGEAIPRPKSCFLFILLLHPRDCLAGLKTQPKCHRRLPSLGEP
jgi:hypothetical protein